MRRGRSLRGDWILGRLPSLEPDVLLVLQADLAVDRVRYGKMADLPVAEAALRAVIMPERHDGLFSGR